MKNKTESDTLKKIFVVLFSLVVVFCNAQQRQNPQLDSLLKVMRDSGISTMVVGSVTGVVDTNYRKFWNWADTVQPVRYEYIIKTKRNKKRKTK